MGAGVGRVHHHSVDGDGRRDEQRGAEGAEGDAKGARQRRVRAAELDARGELDGGGDGGEEVVDAPGGVRVGVAGLGLSVRSGLGGKGGGDG